MNIDDQRREEAARWFACSRRGPMSLDERADYDAWRANPVNQAALNHMHEIWGEMAGLEQMTGPIDVGAPRRRWLDQAVAASVALAALCGGGLYFARDRLGLSRHRVETSIGEQRTATLADGSVIGVNVATKLGYSLRSNERIVDMDVGEAVFFVHHDKSKPFLVRAGGYEVRAVGTAFNVRNRDGRVEVSVIEGTVAIKALAGTRAGRQLSLVAAGKHVSLADPAVSAGEPIQLSSVATQGIADWRTRTLDYEDVPIARVVEDLNTFFPRQLSIDPTLGSRRVTIRLQVDDREHALQTLTGLLEVRLTRGAEQDRLSAASRL